MHPGVGGCSCASGATEHLDHRSACLGFRGLGFRVVKPAAMPNTNPERPMPLFKEYTLNYRGP